MSSEFIQYMIAFFWLCLISPNTNACLMLCCINRLLAIIQRLGMTSWSQNFSSLHLLIFYTVFLRTLSLKNGLLDQVNWSLLALKYSNKKLYTKVHPSKAKNTDFYTILKITLEKEKLYQNTQRNCTFRFHYFQFSQGYLTDIDVESGIDLRD